MTPQISIAVQHHPDRALTTLPRLLAALGPSDVDVVTDPDPDERRNPWRTYRLALQRTPETATHRIVLQDDTVPVPHFPEVAANAIAARPDDLLVFWTGAHPFRVALHVRRAGDQGYQWCAIDAAQWIPTIALCWPAQLIADFLAWDAQTDYPHEFTADDERVSRFVRTVSHRPLVTIPNLVEHPDDTPTVGRNINRQGGRTSCCPPPADCDLLALDWS